MTTTVKQTSLAIPHPLPKGPIREPLFSAGALVATPAAIARLEQDGSNGMAAALGLLRRHITGDFGNLDAEDCEANRHAIAHGYRVLSVYALPQGPVWVITEADRSVTTVLLPSDYA